MNERNYIMQIVCEATQSTDAELVASAYECLVKIMYLYYDHMKFYMEQALIVIMKEDYNVLVKDASAWCLGRICEKLDSWEPGKDLPPLIEVLVYGLNDQPRVAANCAWAIIQLAEHIPKIPTDPLAPFFETLILSLMKSAEGKLSAEINLKATAYEAVAALVSHCTLECFPVVYKLLTEIFTKLQGTLMLQSVIRKLGGEIQPHADQIMAILLQILSTAAKSSTIHEDVFIAIGALCGAVERYFARYMENLKPFLLAGLSNPQDAQVPAMLVIKLTRDICRSIDTEVVPYCHDYMQLLVENLQPAILSCFGDVALAIGGGFELFISAIHHFNPDVKNLSADEMDYYNILREGILEAYVGIVQGLAGANKVGLLRDYIEIVFAFMRSIYLEQEKFQRETPDSLLTTMVGLLGDIAEAFPQKSLMSVYTEPWIVKLLTEMKQGHNAKSQELSKWARGRIKKQI
ncbi:karyopherin beta [Phlyctochytrium bullatum]|nr:karyopherin beta [Phlyctochytrium bullatum]